MSSYALPLIETFVTLLAVSVLAILVLYGAKRLGIGRPRGPVELAGHLPLDARRAIYLVKVADQVLVVGVGEGGFTKLGEVPADALVPTSPPSTPGSGSSFAAILARVTGRGVAAGAGKDADSP
ncbi:MAG: flagellar biosynthetic protein FliO [Polyangiaceae bacterium]